MAGVLSACSKLGDLEIRAHDEAGQGYASIIVDIDVLLAAGTQLLRLHLPLCTRLASLAALSEMVNLQSLDMTSCRSMSDLAPLAGME
jgi:hypothetical protein